jgi:hypothetical protein
MPNTPAIPLPSIGRPKSTHNGRSLRMTCSARVAPLKRPCRREVATARSGGIWPFSVCWPLASLRHKQKFIGASPRSGLARIRRGEGAPRPIAYHRPPLTACAP